MTAPPDGAPDRRRSEVVRGAAHLTTPHAPEAYPGLCVVRGGPAWTVWVICPDDGQGFVARGGERALAYRTVDGGRAEGFELEPGDHATRVRSDLPFALAEWRILRARRPSDGERRERAWNFV